MPNPDPRARKALQAYTRQQTIAVVRPRRPASGTGSDPGVQVAAMIGPLLQVAESWVAQERPADSGEKEDRLALQLVLEFLSLHPQTRLAVNAWSELFLTWLAESAPFSAGRAVSPPTEDLGPLP